MPQIIKEEKLLAGLPTKEVPTDPQKKNQPPANNNDPGGDTENN